MTNRVFGEPQSQLPINWQPIGHGPNIDAGLHASLATVGSRITNVSQVGGSYSYGEGYEVRVDIRPKSGTYQLTLIDKGVETKVEF